MVDALSVHELSAGYNRSSVLHGVSLSVPVGRNVAIIGPNGAGKSTLLKVISGIVRPSSGKIAIAGLDASSWSSEKIVAAGVTHVPEGRQVFGPLSIEDNLRLGAYTQPKNQHEATFRQCSTGLPFRTAC